MSSKLKVEDILWSRNPSPLRHAVKKISFPAMFRVAQGYDSPDENESLARDQIVRIHQVHTQTRVLANVKKNIFLSIPLRYADARFECSNSKISKKDKKDKTPSEKTRPMYLRDVVDKNQLPQAVKFYAGDDLTFQLQLKNNTVADKFSSVTLKNMYEVTYLQGNSIFHNHLDTMVVNIPLYAPIDVYIAEGFRTSTPEKWTKYQSLLGKLVAKHVTFELYPGNQNITYFTDKRLDKARTQEDYEAVVPTGTLVINAGNTRLKLNQRKPVGGSAGASKTLGASAASNGLAPSRKAKAPQAPSSNSNNSTFQGGTPHERRHSLLDEMESAEDRRIMSNAGATVPRSILRNEARKHATEEASASARPAETGHDEEDTVPLGEDAASMNQRLMLRRQSVGDIPNAVHHHAPISHTPEPVRKHSTPVAPLQLQSQWQRQQQMQHQQSLDSPRSLASSNPSVENGGGGGSAMHTSASSPSFNSTPSPSTAQKSRRISAPPKMYRQPSSAGSASVHSDNDNVFSGLAPPVDIPAPDYNEAPPLPAKSVSNHRPPMTHWNSVPERAEPPMHHLNERPPSPPPISTIPTRQTNSSIPTRFAPSPPSLAGGTPPPPPGGPPAPPAAPPPPPVGGPPPPGPPPPPAPPPPPVDGGGSAPAPSGLMASIANAQLKPVSERAERPPAPPKEESPMDNMMRELRRVQERRKSLGDVLANDAAEKMSTGSSGSGSEQTELQKAMERRKLGQFNAGPRAPPNPLPKSNTPKPRFNANNSPRNNFKVNNNNYNTSGGIQSMSDVPSDLKSLTMNQVIQILKLLNLGKYDNQFKEHCIDGDMLVTLTPEILKNDLSFSSQLDINKIMKFIKGWRPK